MVGNKLPKIMHAAMINNALCNGEFLTFFSYGGGGISVAGLLYFHPVVDGHSPLLDCFTARVSNSKQNLAVPRL